LIWIIGGTSEARELTNRLKGKRDFIVTVATCSGAEMLGGVRTLVGRMEHDEMVRFIRRESIDTIVDLSHPYALEVTENARAAGEMAGAAYIRFVRKSSEMEGCIFVDSIEKCALLLEGIRGCVFFTTGIKSIKDFEKVRGTNRFVYRVLPSVFSIQECVGRGVGMEDIVAILGPLPEDVNYHMFKFYKADYVVMKNSGKEGGTVEKVNACKRLGITPIVISRQNEEKGLEDLDDLLKLLT